MMAAASSPGSSAATPAETVTVRMILSVLRCRTRMRLTPASTASASSAALETVLPGSSSANSSPP